MAGGIVLALERILEMRYARPIRIALAATIGLAAFAALVSMVVLRQHRPASSHWREFSIGPATGISASISPTAIRADGITLKGALATAFAMPSVRVFGPSWLDDTRYTIHADFGRDDAKAFRALLQQELTERLHLETHVEVRPFDVFVLTAAESPRLDRGLGYPASMWIQARDARLRDASMDGVAAALQNVLGRPVVDETGLKGTYNLDFAWGEDRTASLVAALRDRFGLRLSPGTRNMEVLIVDEIRRDPSLVLLAHAGRATRGAPRWLRRTLADVMRIH